MAEKKIAVQHPWGIEFIPLEKIANDAANDAVFGNPNKVERVKEIEWQRWVPILGIYRAWRDEKEHLDSTWHRVHSTGYCAANQIYNIFAFGIPIIAGAQYLMRALG